MPRPERAVGWLLGAETAGAASLAMCRAAHLTDDRIAWMLDSGRWRQLFPRVFATFSGPVPTVTLQHAALLYAGEDSALSHETSGSLWRLCPICVLIHVTVPYRREVVDQPGLVIHRSRTLTADDLHPTFSPRRTRVERTVLDLLADRDTADAALSLVADAVRNRSTTPDLVREALLARPRTRWRKVVLDALPDMRAGAQSVLEVRDARIRRRHGLPLGRRQARRFADGAEYLDVLIEEWQLHVELDGRLGHDRASEVWRDMRRDNRSEIEGLRHLRYGWADLLDRPCQVAAQQAEILRQQGWPGPFRRCPDCP